ncbi:hypothetical protein CYY_008176 [Polysphondylium violaceum]|uniref:Uncharacterized protein n=1 Tax=Polysphondylium violaceum TaxID=133409 RepID=A0A8J4PM28_9MYCE|nr:hypothetical protein CYY_008176 [Polysphondylium violaceum]
MEINLSNLYIVGDEEDNEEEEKEEKEEKEKEKDGFFILIEIISSSRESNIPGKINNFMVERDCFDPRKRDTFTLAKKGETLTERRSDMNMKSCYYDFWKVRSNFSIKDFKSFFNSITTTKPSSIRVTKIANNQHQIFIFNTNCIHIPIS